MLLILFLMMYLKQIDKKPLKEIGSEISMETKIKVNDKEISEEEFKLLQESIEKSSDVKLVEIAPGQFKTRLFG